VSRDNDLRERVVRAAEGATAARLECRTVQTSFESACGPEGKRVGWMCEWLSEGYDPTRKGRNHIMESLILAQNKRWRRVLSMQVGRQGW
jgi:hypothetical protein